MDQNSLQNRPLQNHLGLSNLLSGAAVMARVVHPWKWTMATLIATLVLGVSGN